MAEMDTLEAQEAVPNEPQWIFAQDVQHAERDRLISDMVAAFKTVYDPEIPCDIYELGLIYKVDVDENRLIRVEMTLTAPGCPVAGEITRSVETAIGTVPGTLGVIVNIVFEPPWDQARMSDEARVSLDML
ncbi:MAG: iron-sulfur cluster assembly protein [Methylovirgula sp.]